MRTSTFLKISQFNEFLLFKEKKIKKAYKWEVDTGKYIRSTGNIRPDWGKNGFVPESAPTEGPKRKVTVDR